MTRCFDYLTDSVQMEIEMALFQRVRERFHLKDRTYLYDITYTFVVGEGEASILQYGYSRDGHPEYKQVNYALCTTRNPTVPIFHLAFPGNLIDSNTVKETMDRFHDHMDMDGCVVVDRGVVTSPNIREIVDKRGQDLVGGLRMYPKLRRTALTTPLEEYDVEFKRELIMTKEFSLKIAGKRRRCLLYYSEDKAERDWKAREKRLGKAEAGLKEIQVVLKRRGPGRKPIRKALERRIERILERRKCKKFIPWRFGKRSVF